MSSGARSLQLDSISVVDLETVQGDDELYFGELDVWNPQTEEFEDFNLSLTTKIEFTIKDPTSSVIVYTTDDDSGGVTAAPYYANQITQTDPDLGKFTIEIPAIASDLFSIKNYYYDTQITKVGGKKKTVIIGDLRVVRQSTP